MRFMLDTNICSYIIKRKPLEVLTKFKTLSIDDCCISSITVAELKYWVAKNNRLHQKSQNAGSPNVNEQLIQLFINHLQIVDFDRHAAALYGKLRDELESTGIVVGNMDLLIASHAIQLDLVLVTNNTKDFKNLPGIHLENWITAKLE